MTLQLVQSPSPRVQRLIKEQCFTEDDIVDETKEGKRLDINKVDEHSDSSDNVSVVVVYSQPD